MYQRFLAVILCAIAFLTAKPASAALTVTVAPGLPAYVGPCPMTIKFTGTILGDPLRKLSYQWTRAMVGSTTVVPWASDTIPATGKLVVMDTFVVPAPKAGTVTDSLRITAGPPSVTGTTSVTCATPTPKPTPTPSPKATPHTAFNPGVALAPNARLAQPLPVPGNFTDLGSVANLSDRSSWQPICVAHGGSAGSFACYIGVPAGKLVLLWDYPTSPAIDGFRVYPGGASQSGPAVIHSLQTINPVGTQSNSSIHLLVLDMPRAGACYTVTAFQGSAESNKSAQHCIGYSSVAKKVTLQPDKVGSMVEDWYYYVPEEVWKQSNEQPFTRDLLYATVGYTHVASLWSDQSHSTVSQWTNSLYRGYVHFGTAILNGTNVAQAKLNLHADSGGMTCLAHWGAADHMWNPGDHLVINGTWYGGSTIMGPDLSLDVTPIVQDWANFPTHNAGFALLPEQAEVIYQMIILPNSCLTNFPNASLDVTYF